jgi:hypothetical protein
LLLDLTFYRLLNALKPDELLDFMDDIEQALFEIDNYKMSTWTKKEVILTRLT